MGCLRPYGLGLAQGARRDPDEQPGHPAAQHAAAEKGARALQAKGWTEEDCERERQLAIESNRIECTRGKHPSAWKPEEVALLGKLPDAEVARCIGRSAENVRCKRQSLGIPNPATRKGNYGAPDWSAEEDRLVRSLPPKAGPATRGGR